MMEEIWRQCCKHEVRNARAGHLTQCRMRVLKHSIFMNHVMNSIDSVVQLYVRTSRFRFAMRKRRTKSSCLIAQGTHASSWPVLTTHRKSGKLWMHENCRTHEPHPRQHHIESPWRSARTSVFPRARRASRRRRTHSQRRTGIQSRHHRPSASESTHKPTHNRTHLLKHLALRHGQRKLICYEHSVSARLSSTAPLVSRMPTMR